MKFKKDAVYRVKEISERLGVSIRVLQMYAKRKGLTKVDGSYIYYGYQINQYIEERSEYKTKVKPLNKQIRTLVSNIKNDDYIIEVLTAIKNGYPLEQFKDDAEVERFKERLALANQLEVRIKEYKEEIKRMERYVEDYRKNVEYLKGSLSKQQIQMDILLNNIQRRSFIEAKEKGFDDD